MSLSSLRRPALRSAQVSAAEGGAYGYTQRPSSGPDALQVRLLPPQEAHDFEYWARRLVHRELLRDAVAVAVYRIPLLAVPVGLGRRGGRLDMLNEELAAATAGALDCRRGFAPLSTNGTVVEWGGQPPPETHLLDCQRFYGLRPSTEEPTGNMQATIGHRGYGSDTGRWPPASEQQPGQLLAPRAAVSTGAAHAPR